MLYPKRNSFQEQVLAGQNSLISQKVFIKSFSNSQFSHKFVNLSFIITNIRFLIVVIIKEKFTDLRGNCLLQKKT